MDTVALRAAAVRRLDYSPETGVFLWREPLTNRVRKGSPAGTWNGCYLRIRLGDQRLYASQLAFLIVEGWLPPEVDHRDCDPGNNRWNNLRAATHALNMRNQRHRRSNNRAGARGVHIAESGRFRASIRVNGKLKCLGRYDTLEAASAARLAAEPIYFGEFAPCPAY